MNDKSNQEREDVFQDQIDDDKPSFQRYDSIFCEINGARSIAVAARNINKGITIEAVDELEDATLHSDICVTCTPSRQFFLKQDHIAPGTFVAAVGADNEYKQELDPTLLDLALQFVGSDWIAAQDTVSLEESRPGDDFVPSGIERSASPGGVGKSRDRSSTR